MGKRERIKDNLVDLRAKKNYMATTTDVKMHPI